VIAMSEPIKLTFNLFTIEGAVHAADPSLTAAQIKEAYETLTTRGIISPNPSPPLSRVEQLICDILLRQANALAREQQSPGLS